jgi:hypothetical protein
MISSLLLRVSTVLLLCGLVFGIVMGIREDFTLAPAHAHLNLIGFVLMFLVGLYYRIVPAAGAGPLATIQAALLIIGAIVLPIGDCRDCRVPGRARRHGVVRLDRFPHRAGLTPGRRLARGPGRNG